MPLLPIIIAFFTVKLLRCITSSYEKLRLVFVACPSFSRWAGLDLNLAKRVTVLCEESDVAVAPLAGIKSVIDNLIDISSEFLKISAHQPDVPWSVG